MKRSHDTGTLDKQVVATTLQENDMDQEDAAKRLQPQVLATEQGRKMLENAIRYSRKAIVAQLIICHPPFVLDLPGEGNRRRLDALYFETSTSSPHQTPTGSPPGAGLLCSPAAQWTRAPTSGRHGQPQTPLFLSFAKSLVTPPQPL